MKQIWKRSLSLLLLSILLIVALVGCTDEPEPEPTPEPTPEVVETPEPEEIEEEEEPIAGMDIHGAIHRIEYGDNVVYLFGSMHGGRETWYPLADAVEDAMNRADVFVSEIGLADPTEQAEAIQAVAVLPDGQTWVEFLPEEAYDHIVAMAEAWEMNYEDVNTLNPAFLAFSLEMQLALQMAENIEIGNTVGDISVDGYVLERAVERGLPVLSLETIEQQAQILYNPPFEVIVARAMGLLPPEEMMEAIQNSYEPSLGELADMYESNDVTALAESNINVICLAAEEAADGNLWLIYMRETVMNGRSAYYADGIARLLQETEEPTTFFVVVGVSHLIRSLAGEEFTDIVAQLKLMSFDTVPLWQ